MKYCVLAVTGADNTNASLKEIIFYYQRHQIMYVTLSAKDKKLSNFWAKDLKVRSIGLNLV